MIKKDAQDAAKFLSDFWDALDAQEFNTDFKAKMIVAATPVVVARVLGYV